MRMPIGQFVGLKHIMMCIGSDTKYIEIARTADSSPFYLGHMVL